MSFDLKGKYAVVTGAGSGINLAFAEHLLLAGCSVVLADLRLREEAEALVAKYPHPSADNGQASAVFHKCDQSDWASIAETWAFACKTFPRIDLLCPGAGLWEPPSTSFWHPPGISPLARDDPSANPGTYHILTVNLTGPVRFAQMAIDYWLSHQVAGNLLLVASMAAYLPMAETPLYCVSKAGLAAFAQSLAQLKRRVGIRVACICPAATWTPIVQQDHCAGKVRVDDMNMSAAECARVMRDLVTHARYGDGNVVEAMQVAQRGQPSDVQTREVPFEALRPPIDFEGDFSGRNILVQEELFWDRLAARGMRPCVDL